MIDVPVSFDDVNFSNHYPVATPDDITNGYIVRYFIRQVNHMHGPITEIDERTAQSLEKNNLYRVISIEWRIGGPLDDFIGMGNTSRLGVLNANRKSLAAVEKDMPGISYLLSNLKQFWQGK